MKFNAFAVLALAAMLAVPAMAADDEKAKKKGARGARGAATPAAALIKQLEPVGLTEEQVAKIKEMGKASAASMKQIREDAGITGELMKKRSEAQKSLRDSGKKGKDLAAAVNEKAGITEAHAAAFQKLNEVRMKFNREVLAMLTDDQKANVPDKMQRLLKAPGGDKAKGKGKGKKKKDAA
ncbi:MAG: hypothetical protein HKN47_21130 [Pirellulaceae bacterium]|nr:hypothetical protein [Pirellulaceae bacterium]